MSWQAGGRPCARCHSAERLPGTSYCRPCKNEHYREQHSKRSQDPEWRARRNARNDSDYNRNWQYMKNYGLTTEEVMAMYEAQAGCCRICEKPYDTPFNRTMYVDHDHQTGQVRGLLCPPCNTLIGMANDDPAVLEAAIEYLKANMVRGQT